MQWLQDELRHFRSYPRLERAQRLAQQGRHGEARILLEEAQTIDPDNTAIAKALGELCIAYRDAHCVEQQLAHLHNRPALRGQLLRLWIHAGKRASPPEIAPPVPPERKAIAKPDGRGGRPATAPAERAVAEGPGTGESAREREPAPTFEGGHAQPLMAETPENGHSLPEPDEHRKEPAATAMEETEEPAMAGTPRAGGAFPEAEGAGGPPVPESGDGRPLAAGVPGTVATIAGPGEGEPQSAPAAGVSTEEPLLAEASGTGKTIPEPAPQPIDGSSSPGLAAAFPEPAQTAEARPPAATQSQRAGIAATAEPPPATSPADKAYAAMSDKDYPLALHYFNRALEERPDSLQLHMDRIWAAYNLGRADIWLEDLDYTMGRFDEVTDPQTRYIFTSANRWAKKHWQANFSMVARIAGSSTAGDEDRIKTNSYSGFSTAEIGYRLFLNDNPSRFILPFARTQATLKDHSLSPLDHSQQSGLGLSLKPLLQHNLLLTVERRFAEDEAGGNDWLLRSSYSHSRGGEWSYQKDCWDYHNFYADLAHFVESHSTYLTLEYQRGVQRAVAERLTAIPYWVAGVASNNDNADHSITTRLDIGAGIGLQYYARSARLWSYSTRHLVALEARSRVAGNSEDDFTVQLKYILYY